MEFSDPRIETNCFHQIFWKAIEKVFTTENDDLIIIINVYSLI